MEQGNYHIFRSDDGSDSVVLEGSNLSFHSTKGALTESQVVFLQNGFTFYKEQRRPEAITLLEVGFGTGLNALLTAIAAARDQIRVHYISIDRYPLSQQLLRQLNYGILTKEAGLYHRLIAAGWEQDELIHEHFTLHKAKADLLHYVPGLRFNLCYFDAFAPNDQPELWTTAAFQKIKDGLYPGGVLTTYCSKSAVRKTLQTTGFIVEKLKGPPGKREVIRAIATRPDDD